MTLLISIPHTGTNFVRMLLQGMGVDVSQAHIGHEQFEIEFPRHPVRVVSLRDPLLCLITHEQRGRTHPTRENWEMLAQSEAWDPWYFPVEFMGGQPVDDGGNYPLKRAYYTEDWASLMPLIEELNAVPGLVGFYRRHGYRLEWSDG